ncbi:hypothetical protein KIH74_04850 [Kineosporia sp. J2-2]|uniref:Uncharacterized protein n=1 Tax=Kineosporia corallincola TaxID=2835133 RepID=A0ABS5TDS1_9ACTN|nr:hypothetical protein [Kineosporia corallincola]MBT0768238.1 hypothetical protein [Kineosporia corallincola]
MGRPDLLILARHRPVRAFAGPTSPDGWTPVRPDVGPSVRAREVTGPGVAFVDVHDDSEAEDGVHLHVSDGEREARVLWPWAGPVSGSVVEAAGLLTGLFGVPDRAAALETVLRQRFSCEEELTEALGELLDLPGLDDLPDPVPRRAVVAFAGAADTGPGPYSAAWTTGDPLTGVSTVLPRRAQKCCGRSPLGLSPGAGNP